MSEEEKRQKVLKVGGISILSTMFLSLMTFAGGEIYDHAKKISAFEEKINSINIIREDIRVIRSDIKKLLERY